MLLAKLNVLKNYVNYKYISTIATVIGVLNAPSVFAETDNSSASGTQPSLISGIIGADVPKMDLVRNAVILIVVLVILLVFAQVIKSIRLNPAGRRNKRLKVIDQVLIGPKQRLALVEVDGESVLIGITQNQISFLNKTGSNLSDLKENRLASNSKPPKPRSKVEDENWSSPAIETEQEEEEDPDIVTRRVIKLRPKSATDVRREPRL